ncbi:cleavage and polyadenylation specificity factor subunit 3-like [Coregonus clupeaformis]|uniref:cleavage and polyadenylation specificity factor subunit 3-like n=1 Tax=Coregonus clupeaformis TaxID=59861 RepID=UPI001E1C98BA|nr:cleavage and polyadenylation specificity factor subunit 3-like [Coregonus clupeaformis]
MFPKLPRPGHEHSETDPGHPIHWTTLKIFKNITLVHEAGMVTLEWIANPLNDMYADAVTTFVLEIQSNPKAQKGMAIDFDLYQYPLAFLNCP